MILAIRIVAMFVTFKTHKFRITKIKIYKTVILPIVLMGAKLGLSLWGRQID